MSIVVNSRFFHFFLLIQCALSLECLYPCKYTRQLSSAFYVPGKCEAIKTKEAHACFAELEIDYHNGMATIIRNFSQSLPPQFNKQIGIFTQLTSTIDFKRNHVYHKFTHHCSFSESCTNVFLSDYFYQYRDLSYTLFIDELRRLLYLNNTLSPIQCFNTNETVEECSNGKCFAYSSLFKLIRKQGCATDSKEFPMPLIITTTDVIGWISFSYYVECYGSLCNNLNLVENIDRLIANGLHTSMEKTTTTSTTMAISHIDMLTTEFESTTTTTTTTTLFNSCGTFDRNYFFVIINLILIFF